MLRLVGLMALSFVLLAALLAAPALRVSQVGAAPPIAGPAVAQTSTPLATPHFPRAPYLTLQIDLAGQSDNDHLAALLKPLADRGWTAAFFLTPDFAQQHSETAKELLAAGHELGVLAPGDVLALPLNQQVEAVAAAAAAVRQAAGLPAGASLHLRLERYVASYGQMQGLMAALPERGIASVSGVFTVDEQFYCRYCADNRRLMYPLPDGKQIKIIMVPVAVAAPGAQAVAKSWHLAGPDGSALAPLDDALLASAPGADGAIFDLARASYDDFLTQGPSLDHYVHDKFITMVLHPSVTGANPDALAAFEALLAHLASSSHTPTSLAQVLDQTRFALSGGYLTGLRIVAETDVTAGGDMVWVNISFGASLFCPTYYIRLYGQYTSQAKGDWQLLTDDAFHVEKGSYTFPRQVTIPEPPQPSDESYTILAVGRACAGGQCNPPTPADYEARDQVVLAIVDVVRIDVVPAQPVTGQEVKLTAVLSGGRDGMAVASWVIEAQGTRTRTRSGVLIPTVAAPGNPLRYTPPGDSHGEKRVKVTVTWTAGGRMLTRQATSSFLLFFPKIGQDVAGQPNWFTYWGKDGAVPALNRPDVRYSTSIGTAYGQFQPTTDYIYLSNNAAQVHYPDGISVPAVSGQCAGRNFVAVQGIDSVAEVIVHEAQHKHIHHNWDSGGPWRGLPDSDDLATPTNHTDYPGDALPDVYETNVLRTSPNIIDSCNLAIRKSPVYVNYGDNEFSAMSAGAGNTGVAANDWALPGKRTTPAFGPEAAPAAQESDRPAQASGGALNAPVPQEQGYPFGGMASLSGVYGSAGQDTDADGAYNYLRLRAGVQVTVAADYALTAWLGAGGQPALAWASTAGVLQPGAHTVDLLFDGALLYSLGVSGPYTVTSVELATGDEGLAIDVAANVHQTPAYSASSFDPPAVALNRRFSDSGGPGNAPFGVLSIGAGLDVYQAGVYTVSAVLATPAGMPLATATAVSELASAGNYTVSLDFDGASLRQNRAGGPYVLQNLRISRAGADMLVASSVYTTGAYAYSSFGDPPAELAGSYNDTAADSDGADGYDTLRLSAAVTVTIPGIYHLVGSLRDSQGAIIADAMQTQLLASGRQTTTLDFSGATIAAHGANGPYTVTALTLLDGQGRLHSMEPAGYATAAYPAAGFAAPGAIAGQVRDTLGATIANLTMHLVGASRTTAVTDPAGRYHFSGLTPGLYNVYAVPSPDNNVVDRRSVVAVSRGMTSTADFTLEAAGRIAGRVTDSNGQPLQAEIALALFEPAHYATTADGSYVIGNVAPADYLVNITSGGNDWWVYVDGRHVDTGIGTVVQLQARQTMVVDFRRPPADPPSDLALTPQGWSRSVLGQDLAYNARVANIGGTTADGVLLTATVPLGTTFGGESHSDGVTILSTSPHVVWSAGDLTPGDLFTVTLAAHAAVTPTTGAVLTATFAAGTGSLEAETGNNLWMPATRVEPPAVDMSVRFLSPQAMLTGEGEAAFLISYANRGPSAASGVLLTNTLPLSTSLSFVYGFGLPDPTQVGRDLVWTIGDLPSCLDSGGCDGNVYVFVTLDAGFPTGEVLTSTVRISAPGDGNPANDTDLATLNQPAPGPSVDVTQRLTAGRAAAGNDVLYLVTYSLPNRPINTLFLTASLPLPASFVAQSGPVTGVVSGRDVAWAIDMTGAESMGALALVAHLADTLPAGATLTNTVQVAIADANGAVTTTRSTLLAISQQPAHGPDAWGYTFKNSTQSGAGAYDWVEISPTGSLAWSTGSYNDAVAGPFGLGFSFPFYGGQYGHIYIGSNGYLSFGPGATGVPCGAPLPAPCTPGNSIVGLGADGFVAEGITKVYYQALSGPTRFVVQYSNLLIGGPNGAPATFEIVLYPSGQIVMQYASLDLLAPARAVGLQNANGTIGLDHGPVVFPGLAISYAPPLAAPTATPTRTPTASPTAALTGTPTRTPTASPTAASTGTPTRTPTASPTAASTGTPTRTPTATPTGAVIRHPVFLPVVVSVR